jgi:hypothetical protein
MRRAKGAAPLCARGRVPGLRGRAARVRSARAQPPSSRARAAHRVRRRAQAGAARAAAACCSSRKREPASSSAPRRPGVRSAQRLARTRATTLRLTASLAGQAGAGVVPPATLVHPCVCVLMCGRLCDVFVATLRPSRPSHLTVQRCACGDTLEGRGAARRGRAGALPASAHAAKTLRTAQRHAAAGWPQPPLLPQRSLPSASRRCARRARGHTAP